MADISAAEHEEVIRVLVTGAAAITSIGCGRCVNGPTAGRLMDVVMEGKFQFKIWVILGYRGGNGGLSAIRHA